MNFIILLLGLFAAISTIFVGASILDRVYFKSGFNLLGGSLAAAVIFWGLYYYAYYYVPKEQICKDSLNYLRSIGKDVSNMSCPQESRLCVKAREVLKKAGNDVSGINCEPTS